jgi:hypothetical protein
MPIVGGGAVLLLIIAAAIVFLLIRLARGKPVQFAVLVDDEPVGGGVISLRTGREMFLNDTASVFSLVQKKTGKSVAKFSVQDSKLAIAVLKQDRFPKMKEVPPDARGKTFVLRSESGKNLSMKVQSRERKK